MNNSIKITLDNMNEYIDNKSLLQDIKEADILNQYQSDQYQV